MSREFPLPERPERAGAQETPLGDLTVAMATCDDDPGIFALTVDAVAAEPLGQPAVIVDMSRGDGIRRVAEARRDAVRYIAFPESRGLSESRNRLVEAVGTRYLAFVDADAVPAPGWARALRRAFEEDDRLAVVGARTVPCWPGRRPKLFDTGPAFDLLAMFDLGSKRLDVPRIVGTSFALDRERLPSDPPFSLDLGRRPGSLLSFEEVDFCLAVRARGWRIAYEPRALVHHHVRPERTRWAWMLRRAHVAGQESRLTERRLEPLPRDRSPRDYLFLATIAPAFLAGRVVARRKVSADRRP